MSCLGVRVQYLVLLGGLPTSHVWGNCAISSPCSCRCNIPLIYSLSKSVGGWGVEPKSVDTVTTEAVPMRLKVSSRITYAQGYKIEGELVG